MVFRSRDYIEKVVKISRASPEVLFALDQGAIGVGRAFELCRLPYAIMPDELTAKYQVYRYKGSELK
ncbi:unnamed protein product, partial [marine sediment metagenome]